MTVTETSEYQHFPEDKSQTSYYYTVGFKFWHHLTSAPIEKVLEEKDVAYHHCPLEAQLQNNKTNFSSLSTVHFKYWHHHTFAPIQMLLAEDLVACPHCLLAALL